MRNPGKLLYLIILVACIGLSGCGLCVKYIPSGIVAQPTPSAEDQFIKIGSVNYHYAEYPAGGPDVLMVHGWSSSTYTWEKVAPTLQKQGYHVWCVDMQGFGWSDKPGGAAYDPLTLMRDVKAWMDAVGLKKVIYVGNSLGGGVGFYLAVEHPEVVDKLILIDAACLYPVKDPFITDLLRLPGSAIVGKLIFSRWMISTNLKGTYYHSDWVTDDQIDAYYTRMRTIGALDAMIAMARGLDLKKLKPYTRRAGLIQSQTMIIHGQNDTTWVPIESSRRLRQNIPHSILVEIPECGHMPQEEHPAITTRLILDFLDGKLAHDTVLPKPST